MSYRISKISIENFKFFKENFKIEPKRKNVLLYGENGSGKSSIYWSIYTHFQAYTKDRAEGQKYFILGNPQSLRNKFADNAAHSSIKITFDDGVAGSKEIIDSDTLYYPDSDEIKRFMMLTSRSSDFMNYKFLSNLFDFKNSEDNEIFSILESEALPYFDLEEELTDLKGSSRGTNLAGDWWSHINDCCNKGGALPRNTRNNSPYNMNSNEYKRLISLLNDFNHLLKDKLVIFVGRANNIIRDTFNIDAEILLDYKDAEFNRKISKRHFDGRLHKPKVTLTAKMNSDKLVDTSEIKHPHTFFNEAKITCMALALRLAILESHPTSDQTASVLFVDDLLISLDMPVRRKVISVLLDYSDRFQMFIFTHDRAFFHLVDDEIRIRKEVDKWEKYELYVDDDNGIDKPCLIHNAPYLEKAKQFLYQLEIPASVNAARKATEDVLKQLLPKNQLYSFSETGMLDLNGMIQKFEELKKSIGLGGVAIHLDSARKFLLNPFSHDDVSTPFYKEELKQVIKEIEQLYKIERKDIVGYKDVKSKEIELKLENKQNNCCFAGTILFKEVFPIYKYEDNVYMHFPFVELKTSSDPALKVGLEDRLNKLFARVASTLHINAANRPAIKDCLFVPGTDNKFLNF